MVETSLSTLLKPYSLLFYKKFPNQKYSLNHFKVNKCMDLL